MEKSKNLFAEFPPISKKQWLEKLEKDLKGKPLEDLQWQLNETITIEPFYHAEDANENWKPIFSKNNSWAIGEDIFVKNLKEANQQALHALEYGAEALRFVIEEEILEKDVNQLLQGVEPEWISIHFKIVKKENLSVLSHFFNFLKNAEKDISKIHGSLNFNFGKKIQLAELEDWMEALRFSQKNLPNFKVISVDTTSLSVEPQQTAHVLAATLQQGNDFINLFSEQGFSIAEIQNTMQFAIPIGKSYFVEIAKIRALKLLWANVLAAHGEQENLIPTIDAHLSAQAQTEDANTNMIQSTTQAMAAVVGGVDRLTILPSDAFSNKSTPFSRRIARNVQHILKMESFMDRVADPAAGSYYIEKLTEQLAERAWELFQELNKSA